MATSLYIHVPFCKRRCLYCDFYSTVYDPKLAAAYIDVLVRQIAASAGTFSSVYIGGGTPTVIDRKLLERLLAAARAKTAAGGEFTVEANPESVDDDTIKLLLAAGVNRLSIGLQSLDERKLKRLGRIHNAHKGRESVLLAAKRGFKNISADLIFGVWDERPEDWERDLDGAVKLPLSHLSCYSLTYEKETPLFAALRNRSMTPLEDAVVAQMYETAIDRLSVRGFKQYEVSNFARDGHECKHNLHYWDNGPYAGLGASAVSYLEGVRSKNITSVKGYIERFETGKGLAESSEKLSPARRAKETAAVKIRTRDGIDYAWFKAHTGFDFPDLEKKAVSELLEKGLIKYKKDGTTPTGIALKRKGFLFCDIVSSTLL